MPIPPFCYKPIISIQDRKMKENKKTKKGQNPYHLGTICGYKKE
jgi:hypothetical protein